MFNEYLSKLKALKDESEIAANAEREEQVILVIRLFLFNLSIFIE